MMWSWILASIGVFGLYLTTKKMWQGFAVGLAVQTLWIAYAVVTKQYGFVFSACAYGAVNFIGLRKWLSEKGESPEKQKVKSIPEFFQETLSEDPWKRRLSSTKEVRGSVLSEKTKKFIEEMQNDPMPYMAPGYNCTQEEYDAAIAKRKERRQKDGK